MVGIKQNAVRPQEEEKMESSNYNFLGMGVKNSKPSPMMKCKMTSVSNQVMSQQANFDYRQSKRAQFGF